MARPRESALFSFMIYTCLAIFPFIGLLLLGLGGGNVWKAHESSSWPTVMGEVVSSEAKQTEGGGSPMYQAFIKIAYRVNGSDYQTDNLLYGRTFGSGDASEAEMESLQYLPGRKIKVSYNPADPSEAVVHAGMHPDLFWLVGGGLAFLLPGIMFAVIYRSSETGSPVAFRVGIGMFGIIFMLIGTPMLITGAIRLRHAWASSSWPTTEGKIVFDKRDSSETVERDDDGDIVRSESHAARLVYKYSVDGMLRYSNVRQFGQLAGASEEWADEIAERYPLGKVVQVSYSPEDPSLAVLEPGIHDEAWYLPGAGLAFFLFGLAVVIFPALRGALG